MKNGLAKLYQAIDWAKEQTRDHQRLGGSLRTAFILLQEGLCEIYQGLSGPEQDDVRALLAGVQERWGWKKTYEDGAGEDFLERRRLRCCWNVKSKDVLDSPRSAARSDR